MRFSAFTRFSHFRFSGAKPRPQVWWESLGRQFDVAFDTTGANEAALTPIAEKFALAYHLARIEWYLVKAGNQRNVQLATDLLPLREADFQAVPGAMDTIFQRGQRLAAIRLLPGGATTANISNMLLATIGSAFVKLRVVAPAERATDLPTSAFTHAGTLAKFLQLNVPMAVTGTQYVGYSNIDHTLTSPVLLAIGDVVTVQGENKAQAEVVTVTNVLTLPEPIYFGSTPVINFFQADFTKAHDVGATVTTMNYPRWSSTQCFLYVEVTPAAAVDPVIRGRVDALMQRVARGWCQWATVAASGGSIGPFTLGVSGLGTATIGTVSA